MIDKIGMDIEFEVVDKDGRVIRVDDRIAKGYSIGHDDGALELRPDPASTPEELVENIKKLIEKFNKAHPELTLSTKDTQLPLGGHIHLSFQNPDWKSKKETLFAICEHTIGDTIWLSEELRRKNDDLWNDIGEYQVHPNTFEYKKSPASIAITPAFLLLNLKLVKYWIETEEKPNDEKNPLKKLNPLTKKEKSIYLYTFHSYKTNNISNKVIDFWLYNAQVPEPQLRVDFHLEKSWDREVKEDIINALQRNNINLYIYIDIMLSKRTIGIKVDGYEPSENFFVKNPVFPYIALPKHLIRQENWQKERDKILPALVEYCGVFQSPMSDFQVKVSLVNK